MPDTAQDILPQQVLAPAPASETPASPPPAPSHDCPAEVQQRRAPDEVGEHESVPQQSALSVQLAEPNSPQLGGATIAAQRPPEQRLPAQHSVSSTQDDPAR